MNSSLLRPIWRRPHLLGIGLGASLTSLHQASRRTVKLDSNPMLSVDSYRNNAQTPLLQQGKLNPGAVRQISSGSIIGVLGGVAVSAFSRSLAMLIGLLVVGIQWASSYGINVIPYRRMQKYVKGIDLRSAVQDNVAFKLAFGTTFAAAAFLHF